MGGIDLTSFLLIDGCAVALYCLVLVRLRFIWAFYISTFRYLTKLASVDFPFNYQKYTKSHQL